MDNEGQLFKLIPICVIISDNIEKYIPELD